MQGRVRGFTLIELIIVTVVVAILAAIAIPSYQSSIRKSRRADAQAVLLNMQLQIEKWRANQPSYADPAGGEVRVLGNPPAGTGIATYYTFAVSNDAATTFTVTATAITGKGQTNDQQSGTTCTPMSINQSGTRSPAACWTR